MGNVSAVDIGIDVGSTTTKICALDAQSHNLLHTSYKRHGARQAESVRAALNSLAKLFPQADIRLALTGSGAAPIADKLGVPFVQEVVANACAIQALYPRTRCAIELGGQDAKMIFFRANETTGALDVADMRMNGSCAGGTGAFIDEIASVLNIPIEQFNEAACRGRTVYDISGRCGVYAKTDIQPLLNQGASRDDLALSAFHAIAKQTLGGLAQGIDVRPPIIFEGGPLTFNPTLVDVFKERLDLADDQAIVPEHPETMVARGAALSLSGMFADASATIDPAAAAPSLVGFTSADDDHAPGTPFFETAAEHEAFTQRNRLPKEPHGPESAAAKAHARNGRLRAWLGIDSGSTTTKLALVADDGQLIDSFYANNEGDPLQVARRALIDLHGKYADAGVALDIAGVGTTGYGELLFHRALHADYHTVETVAHAHAATRYVPDASFILDIGGQDMKAIWLSDGVIGNIVVNEACSSGCGSFLENFAQTLGIPTSQIADSAFSSEQPAVLGSRCTVFMNSSIVSEQKNGRMPADIMAGLCRSIIANVFTKVVRVPNLDSLGRHIVVQGGTFRNDAVLCALEQHIGRPVTRAPYPGLMGAIGVALLTREHMAKQAACEADSHTPVPAPSTFIGFDALGALSYRQHANVACPFCANRCNRTVIAFADGATFVTGNRCPRGEIVGDPKDPATRSALKAANEQSKAGENLFETRQKLLFQDWPIEQIAPDRGITIGIPRVLAFWDTMPFWNALLRSLGFAIRLSRPSTRAMFEEGLPQVTSDTICFPAKLVHGHIHELARAGVDRVFMPIITTVPSENTASTSISMCAVVKGYPMVVKSSDDPAKRWGIPFDSPLFHWYSTEDRDHQLIDYLESTFGIPADQALRAIKQADKAQRAFKALLTEAGAHAIESARSAGSYAIVLASRPYHNDPLVNHDLPKMLSDMGHSVLPPDAVPGIADVDLSASRIDIVNNFHQRMLASAVIAADSPALEYVQLVSFGCGHDAYLSDEICRLMKERSGKQPLVLKLDESDVAGPLRIRVRLLKRLKMYRMNAKLLRRLTVVLSVINKQTALCGQLILLQAGLINRRIRLEQMYITGKDAAVHFFQKGKALRHFVDDIPRIVGQKQYTQSPRLHLINPIVRIRIFNQACADVVIDALNIFPILRNAGKKCIQHFLFRPYAAVNLIPQAALKHDIINHLPFFGVCHHAAQILLPLKLYQNGSNIKENGIYHPAPPILSLYFASLTAIAPAVNQLAIAEYTDNLAVIRTASAACFSGVKFHLFHGKVKFLPFVASARQNCRAERAHQMAVLVNDDVAAKQLFKRRHNALVLGNAALEYDRTCNLFSLADIVHIVGRNCVAYTGNDVLTRMTHLNLMHQIAFREHRASSGDLCRMLGFQRILANILHLNAQTLCLTGQKCAGSGRAQRIHRIIYRHAIFYQNNFRILTADFQNRANLRIKCRRADSVRGNFVLYHGRADNNADQLARTACGAGCHDFVLLLVELLFQQCNKLLDGANRISLCPDVRARQNIVLFIYNHAFGGNGTDIDSKICMLTSHPLKYILSHCNHIIKCFQSCHQTRFAGLYIIGQIQNRNLFFRADGLQDRHDINLRRASGRFHMDNAVKSSARVLPRSPNICRRRWSHFIRAQIFDLCIHVLFARIMHHAVGYIHPTMYFHAHICDGLFQIQIGKWIHNRKELTDNADTQRFRRFIQRRVAEYLLYFPIDAVNILSG